LSTDTSRTFTIRRCSVDDAQTVAALGARLFAESYGPTHPEPELSRYLARSFAVKDVRATIADKDVTMLMAEDPAHGAVAYAYVRTSVDPPTGVEGNHVLEIVRFYVDARCQGRGIGAALMQECCAEAKSRGGDVVWLQVWKEAPWAVGFYRRMGFSVVGSAKFYFGEQIGDDHVMAKRVD
jgi:ribosomal protein S18 acetylase RimI-like enzyme